MSEQAFALKDLRSNKVYALAEGDTIIGRGSDCTVTLSDTVLSREHALIRRKGNQLWVKDLDSTNGTQLNYGSVGKEIPVKHGDVLTLGDQELQILFPGGGPVERPTRAQASSDSYVAHNSMGGRTTLRQAFSLPAGWSNNDKGNFSKSTPEKADDDKPLTTPKKK